jgi:hypothetical protein
MKKVNLSTPEPQEGIEVKQKPSRVLIELLVFGHDKDKPKVNDLNKELQEQLSKHRKTKNRVRVFWKINNDESIEEMKQWLIENSECKYSVFATDGKNYSVPSNFVVSIVDKVKKLEDAIKSVRDADVFVSKKKPEIAKISEAQVIE